MWLASEIEWQLIVEYLTKQKTDHFNPFLAEPKFVVLSNLPTGMIEICRRYASHLNELDFKVHLFVMNKSAHFDYRKSTQWKPISWNEKWVGRKGFQTTRKSFREFLDRELSTKSDANRPIVNRNSWKWCIITKVYFCWLKKFIFCFWTRSCFYITLMIWILKLKDFGLFLIREKYNFPLEGCKLLN